MGKVTTTPDGKAFISTYQMGLLFSTNSGSTWTNLGLVNKDLRGHVIDSAGNIFVSASGDGGIFKTTDSGNTWVEKDSGLTVKPTRTIALGAGGYLYAGTYLGGVFRSTNGGNSWKAVNTGISNYDIFDLLIADSGKIFVGTGQGGIFKSTNNGDNWVAVNNGVTYLHISQLTRNSVGEIFATTWDKGWIFRSSDDGNSWVRSDSGVSMVSIQGIVFQSSGKGFVVGGKTASGSSIYASIDNGRTWFADTPGDSIMQSVGITSDGYVLVSGYSGALYRSASALTSTSVKGGTKEAPIQFRLAQNYPNPFNPSTTIQYQLQTRSKVEINIYNEIGQLVRRLVDDFREVGVHSVLWDGKDSQGRVVSSGTYFYQVRAGNFVDAKKMLLLK